MPFNRWIYKRAQWVASCIYLRNTIVSWTSFQQIFQLNQAWHFFYAFFCQILSFSTLFFLCKTVKIVHIWTLKLQTESLVTFPLFWCLLTDGIFIWLSENEKNCANVLTFYPEEVYVHTFEYLKFIIKLKLQKLIWWLLCGTGSRHIFWRVNNC